MPNWLYTYLLIINGIAFVIMGIDKQKAKKGKWRIKEFTLFLIAIVGGVVGSLIGMYVFHHKTNKLKFKLGMPLLLIFEVIVIIILQLNLS